MERRISLITFTGLLVVCAICGTFWVEKKKVEAENVSLRADLQDLKTKVEQEAPIKILDPARDREVEAQHTELLQLRNEVAQLRAKRDAFERAEEEIALLRANHADPTSTAGNLMGTQSISRDDWKFEGFETPQAALISGMAAMKEGQVVGLLETFTPEERQRFEAQMQGKSEEEIAARFQKEFGQVTGIRTLAEQEIKPGEVVLDVYLEGIGKLKKYRMTQVNGEWKAGGPINQIVDSFQPLSGNESMMYYMSNPELMKRYFPQMYKTMQEQKQREDEQPASIKK